MLAPQFLTSQPLLQSIVGAVSVDHHARVLMVPVFLASSDVRFRGVYIIEIGSRFPSEVTHISELALA